MNNLITRIKMSIADSRTLEELKAKSEKLMADIDYVAMMTDVEIPTEEDYVNNVSED